MSKDTIILSATCLACSLSFQKLLVNGLTYSKGGEELEVTCSNCGCTIHPHEPRIPMGNKVYCDAFCKEQAEQSTPDLPRLEYPNQQLQLLT